VFELYSKFKEQEKDYYRKLRDEKVADTKTTLPLEQYEGEYSHSMLGKATVKNTGAGLIINFNDFLMLPIQHWHYDTFMSTKENPYRAQIDFNFKIGTDATVKSFDAFGETFTKQN